MYDATAQAECIKCQHTAATQSNATGSHAPMHQCSTAVMLLLLWQQHLSGDWKCRPAAAAQATLQRHHHAAHTLYLVGPRQQQCNTQGFQQYSAAGAGLALDPFTQSRKSKQAYTRHTTCMNRQGMQARPLKRSNTTHAQNRRTKLTQKRRRLLEEGI